MSNGSLNKGIYVALLTGACFVVLLLVFLAPVFVRQFEPREFDCEDFETQWDAQLVYIKGIWEQGRDIWRLDRDKNGLACDGYFTSSYLQR